jgi:hypothetical protein
VTSTRDKSAPSRLAQNVVADEDIVETAIGHHFRLAELLAGDASGSGSALHGGDQGALVGLDMGTVGEASRIAGGLNPCDVALDHIKVDHDRRRAELADERGLEGSVCHTASWHRRVPALKSRAARRACLARLSSPTAHGQCPTAARCLRFPENATRPPRGGLAQFSPGRRWMVYFQ